MKRDDVVERSFPYLELPAVPGVVKQVLNDSMVLVDFGEEYHRAVPKSFLKVAETAELARAGGN